MVSAAVAVLLTDRPLEGFGVVEVGSVQLRGFVQREAAYAVVADHLVPVDVFGDDHEQSGGRPRNLPAIEDALAGRTDELMSVWDGLKNHHVVSIIGVGGMGKTRLALEAATAIAHGFGAGAWWCDLAPATSADAVAQVLLSALDVRQSPGRTAVESTVSALAGRDDLAARLDAAIVAEVDEEARTMDTDQAVAVALDALDPYLAATDPDRLTATESAR
jgi:hypothetical protein